MRKRTTGRIAAAALSAAALAAGAALAAAPAHSATDVHTEDTRYGFVYDNVALGDGQPPYLVIAGGTLEEFCAGGDPFNASPGSAVLHVKVTGEPGADGARLSEAFVTRGLIELYANDGMGAPAYLDHRCGIWAETGVLPEPYAIGAGTVKSGTEFSWAGGIAYGSTWNSARGPLRTADGEVLVVWADARVTLAPEFVLDHVGFQIRNR
ncbi:hypothetical protein GCM10022200_22600 [Microbacterium awajiense]|uniref:Uncharacterized protein n=1 Tax=Microbacterium awajiense TaxID=415214 RepID=A0ABP7AR69_9MICO